MGTRLVNIAFAGAGAGAAWLWISFSSWVDVRAGLLTALSIVAAAALVRLARGLPFSNADHFEVDEIRRVSAAIQQIVRAVLALLIVALAAIVFVIFSDVIQSAVSVEFLPPLSAAMGLVLAYILARIVQIGLSDYDLVKLQSKFLVRAVERKDAKKLEASGDLPKPGDFKSPEGYGRYVQ